MSSILKKEADRNQAKDSIIWEHILSCIEAERRIAMNIEPPHI